MSTFRLLLILFCSGLPVFALAQKDQVQVEWTRLLARYVDASGTVDYGALKEEEDALEAYIHDLGNAPPDESWSKNKQLAYYINLYNAATLKLILQHYPVSSIRDIAQPWGKKWIRIGNRQLSLNHIEHRILRKMEEPRIHFAINCASVSCPKLLNQPFEEEHLDQQLELATRAFINNPAKNEITPEQLRLSPIFKWYRKDFVKTGTLQEFIRQYSDTPISVDARISYLKYDWSLNDQ